MPNTLAIFNKMCPSLDTSPVWDYTEIRIGCLPTTQKSENNN